MSNSTREAIRPEEIMPIKCYKIDFTCTNCLTIWTAEIANGFRVDIRIMHQGCSIVEDCNNRIHDDVVCIKCGCKSTVAKRDTQFTNLSVRDARTIPPYAEKFNDRDENTAILQSHLQDIQIAEGLIEDV